MGRPVTELVYIYSTESSKLLCDPQRICDSVYVSMFNQLSLSEYVLARTEHCKSKHKQACTRCTRMLQVATTVLQEGFCLLSSAFKTVSPTVKYQTDTARRLLLQMPLVSVRVGSPSSGKSFIVLIEKFQGTDFTKVSLVLNGFTGFFTSTNSTSLDKSCNTIIGILGTIL